MWQWSILFELGLIVMLIMLSACAKNSSDSFCLIYQPIYMSDEDSAKTKIQIDANNAAWEELCN